MREEEETERAEQKNLIREAGRNEEEEEEKEAAPLGERRKREKAKGLFGTRIVGLNRHLGIAKEKESG